MFEIVILGAIVIALYRRNGERWEWNRARLNRALADLSDDGGRAVKAVRRSTPGLVAQCKADMASLIRDMMGVLSPSARQQIESKAKHWIDKSAAVTGQPKLQPAGVGRAVPNARDVAGLQKRYLDGRISLDQYVEEADRLNDDA